MKTKPKTLTGYILADRILEQIRDENIAPYTHYIILNKLLFNLLICHPNYISRLFNPIDGNPTVFEGAIYGLWVMLDDKAIEMIIKPTSTLD